MRNGLDFSFGSGLTTAQLQAGQMAFVGRYLSGGNSKDIVKAELSNYLSANIAVIFFWETDGIMRSFADGQAAAQAANLQLAALGAPLAKVFFTADAQVMPDLKGYMDGVRSVIGYSRTGFYGGLQTVQSVFNQSLAKYAVQTYAWSGTPTVWDNRALVRQYRNGVKFGPATVDLEQAAFWGKSTILTMQDDFGQYPTPSAAPTPPPSHTGLYSHTFNGSQSVGAVAKLRNETERDFVDSQITRGTETASAIYNFKPKAGTVYKTTNP